MDLGRDTQDSVTFVLQDRLPKFLFEKGGRRVGDEGIDVLLRLFGMKFPIAVGEFLRISPMGPF